MTTAYITHYLYDKHNMGDDHPESPKRLGAIRDRLIAGQLLDHLLHVTAEPANKSQLIAAHEAAYVNAIFAKSPEAGLVELEPETLMNPDSLNAALYAAGAVINGVDMVMQGEAETAFCAVRPPGHHAEYNKGMGFCFFNNIAVGARHALNQYGLRRIAIVDFDVHHGNGTEHIFEGESSVLYTSSYQHPFYPYSDPGKSHDNILHMPLAAGTAGDEFREVMREQLFPALERFRPELMLISAGFDGHKADPMGQLRLDENDFAWITDGLMDVAETHCQGRVVSVLEGGYDLDALGRSAFAHIRSLMKLG